MANRHLSRSVVMQSLFEWDFNGRKDNDIKPVLARNAEEFAPGLSDFSFINTLAESILKKAPELDVIIEKAAPEWPIEKISIVDRNILRLGLYELLFSDREEVPAKVAINEAIELAKTFGGENSGKFVNGVLGSVYKELGEPGKDNVSKPKNKNIDLKNLPIEKLGGAVVYGRSGDDIYLALVHDIFGHWTLSKGHYLDNETDQEAVVRIIRKEIGLPLKSVGEELGRNEYVASDPDKGKIKKQVVYYLAEAPYQEFPFEKSGGLDDARWFKLTEILDLNFYNDILPIVTKAVNGLLGNK